MIRIGKKKKTLLIYGSITIAFVIWMAYYDDHSLALHKELNQKIYSLESKKRSLTSQIGAVQHQIEILKHPDSLRKYAREEFFYKTSNETIYLIDSITINSLGD